MSCRLPMPLSRCLLLILFIAAPFVLQAAPADAPSAADQSTAVAARCQKCGDGYCARSCENEFTCPADCAPQTKVSAARCGKCGDGQCVRQCGETPESCPADCGGWPSEIAASAPKADECAAYKPAAPDAKKE